MADRPLIVLTNDDGIDAPGLRDLHTATRGLGKRFVVAPVVNQSAASHSFSLRRPIQVERCKPGWYAVYGTPTDCVLISHHGIFRRKIDIVISGINDSPNLGDDVLYSGTVAAAIEAALLGIPAIALSYLVPGVNFEPARSLLHSLVPLLLNGILPKKCLLNINIPAGSFKGVKVSRLGHRIYKDMAIKSQLPDGRVCWTIDGEMGFKESPGSDFEAVHSGYISVTPLHLDMTHHSEVRRLERTFKKLGLI
uniref:5'-nucleotidase SurE n=1 Tax=candidate division WOR-3 bacterium TaxID=2052148 RepID=A0A7V3V065_UNCW3